MKNCNVLSSWRFQPEVLSLHTIAQLHIFIHEHTQTVVRDVDEPGDYIEISAPEAIMFHFRVCTFTM